MDCRRDVPGLSDLANRQAKLKTDLEALQSLVKDGRARVGKLDDLLPKSRASREPMVDSGLQFVRRTTEEGHHYFIANLTDKAIEGWFPLSVKCASVAILDPLTGADGLAATRSGALPEIHLQLAPGESLILRTFDSKQVQANPWNYLDPYWRANNNRGPMARRFHRRRPETPGILRHGQTRKLDDARRR